MTTYFPGTYIDLDGNVFSVNERARQILDSFDLAFSFTTLVNPSRTAIPGSSRFRSADRSRDIAPTALPSTFSLFLANVQNDLGEDPLTDVADTIIRTVSERIRAGSDLVFRFSGYDLFLKATSVPVEATDGIHVPVRILAARGNPPANNSAARVLLTIEPLALLADNFVDGRNLITDEAEFANVQQLPASIGDNLNLHGLSLRKLTRNLLGPDRQISLGQFQRLSLIHI